MRNPFVSREEWLKARRKPAAGAKALGAVEFLSLAAAPTFALMALHEAVLGGGALDALCMAAPDASPLSGMAVMYGLMSAFHVAPWLRLIDPRRRNNSAIREGRAIPSHL
jgi:hypothetical protein